MSDRARRVQPCACATPGYPPARSPAPVADDRRRFLRQVALGAGAVCLGLPSVVTGQPEVPPIDFSMLDDHDPLPPPQPALLEREFAARLPAESNDTETGGTTPSSLPSVTMVTENRALWVTPGYLVMLQWERPETDESPVAALEAANADVADYLSSTVTSSTQIHDVAQLHTVETGVLGLLAPRVAPATVLVLHVDHDCTTVCSMFSDGPVEDYPEIMGRMPAPGY